MWGRSRSGGRIKGLVWADTCPCPGAPVDRHLDVWLWSSGSSGQAVNLGACTTVALTPLNMEETTLKVLRNKGKWPRTAPGVGSAARSPRGNMWAKGPRKCAPSPTPVPGCYILSPAPALWHSTLTACPPRLCSILRWFRGPALPVGVSALRTVALSILILPESYFLLVHYLGF